MKAINEDVAEHFELDPEGVIAQIVEANADSKSLCGVRYCER